MLTNKAFVAALQDVATKRKTTYMWGVFGSLVTDSKINEKKKQYPNHYTADKLSRLKALVGTETFAFDCVGLIKALLWGWNGDTTHPHGGARYQSGDVPDLGANTLFARCEGQTTDFKTIQVGEAVWLHGHIGIYIGNGIVVESTPSWNDGVQFTACWNIGTIAGMKGRAWSKHGKLPWIDYTAQQVLPELPKTITPSVVEGEQGQEIPAYILDGVTYVPVRQIAEAAGLRVEYDAVTKTTKLRR